MTSAVSGFALIIAETALPAPGTSFNTAFADCRADYLNLSESKLDHVLLERCRLTEAAMESMTLRSPEFTDCDLTRTNLYRTSLKGIDMRTCTLEGLMVNLPDLRGMIVTPVQAAVLASLLGLIVK